MGDALCIAALLVLGVMCIAIGAVSNDSLLFIVGCLGLGTGLRELYFESFED